MSYIIEPMPLIPFLEESKIRLPRFQRKATWDKKQNFELVISVLSMVALIWSRVPPAR